jgi:hypothetical protein
MRRVDFRGGVVAAALLLLLREPNRRSWRYMWRRYRKR